MSSAVVFDLDGVLVDSEAAWDGARRELVREQDGAWTDTATRDMMGMSSPEWSRYVANELGVGLEPEEINARIVERLLSAYREKLPLLPGAVRAVERLAKRWPLGLASSSNREVIDLVLAESGLGPCIAASVSSEEVGRGKPAPNVYEEVLRRLDADPGASVAIEDSENGIRSAHAAGMHVVAIPNPDFPPADDALAHADHVATSLDELTTELVGSFVASTSE